MANPIIIPKTKVTPMKPFINDTDKISNPEKPFVPSSFVQFPDTVTTVYQPKIDDNFVSDNNPSVDRNKLDQQAIPRQLRGLLNNLRNAGYTLPNTELFFDLSYSDLKTTMNDAFNEDGKIYEAQATPKYQKNLIHNPHGKGRGFARPGKPDTINSLSVIDGKSNFDSIYNTPSRDTKDIIAFYFHDLVNDRYIPFRATVKGINEQAAAEWSDISYIGRADKIFNYKGFSRNLNFSFLVVANSLLELLPMWTRINYMVTCIKPSGYTKVVNSANQKISHFIIPPMMTVTIGDMYKEQPVTITSVAITIPDDAPWETLSEQESSTEDWTYFNGLIKLNNSKNKSAQFPRVCEITIQTNILEQTLPQMGDHNFGSYNPTLDMGKFSDQLLVGDAPYNSKIERVVGESSNESMPMLPVIKPQPTIMLNQPISITNTNVVSNVSSHTSNGNQLNTPNLSGLNILPK